MYDSRRRAMAASLAAAVLMLVGKSTAYLLTGSSAILSDAAESVVHLVATGFAAFSLWFSRQAACERHPYGHGKIAYFSAGFEGALILSAAAFIVYDSIRALIDGPELEALHVGILITVALALVNAALGLYLVRVGRRTNALILVANGKDVLMDVWTSLAVAAGVVIVWLTRMPWLDPVVAMLAAVNIVVTGVGLVRRSYSGLIDEADPAKTASILESLRTAADEGLIEGFHQLRHRQSNDAMWIELHVLMPGHIEMSQAHRQVTRLEESIRQAFPDYQVHVTSHIEPTRHERAHPAGHPGQDPYGSAGGT